LKNEIGSYERQLCDIQGRLFELSHRSGLESSAFVKAFMNSQTCAFLDMPYDRLQWAGEEYILENLLDECSVPLSEKQYSREALFWMGYVYRYWHLTMGESSQEIYAQAGAERMEACYLGFHTLDVVMAIENLKEIYRQELIRNNMMNY
jgi:hypothetical protein